jgi:hypothetical protein
MVLHPVQALASQSSCCLTSGMQLLQQQQQLLLLTGHLVQVELILLE